LSLFHAPLDASMGVVIDAAFTSCSRPYEIKTRTLQLKSFTTHLSRRGVKE
jgi:hypothetical protein